MKKLLLGAVDFTAFFYSLSQFDTNVLFSVIFLAFQVLNILVKIITAIVNFCKMKDKTALDEQVSQIRNDIINQMLKGDKNGKN